jgi:hypothetical protein
MDKAIQLICNENKNVRISAVAGSGKTTAILKIAEKYNGKILLLTYNRKLKDETRMRTTRVIDFDIYTLHGYCTMISGTSCYTDTQLHYPDAITSDYDLIAIDEIQDFTDRYYEFVSAVIKHNVVPCQLLILGDERQMIYEHKGAKTQYLNDPETKFGIKFETVVFDTSYRITKEICKFINVAFPDIKISAFKSGPKPQYYRMSRKKSIQVIISDIKFKLSNGYKTSDFFILLYSAKSELKSPEYSYITKEMDGIPIYLQSNDDETPQDKLLNGKIPICTFHKTKGLERRVVYVLGFDNYYGIKYGRDLSNLFYVAATRSLSELYLFQTHDYPLVQMDKLNDICILTDSEIIHKDIGYCSGTCVTALCSHQPVEVIEAVMSKFEKKTLSGSSDVIKLPSFIAGKCVGTIEDVSAINGTCLIRYYQKRVYLGQPKWSIDEQIEIEFWNYKLRYKRNQIACLKWLKNEVADTVLKRLNAVVKYDKTNKFEAGMDLNVNGMNITGSIDLLTQNDIYEFKCTSSVKDEHFIQLLLYGKMYEKIYGKKRNLKLYYPLSNELYEIESSSTLEELVSIMHKQ